MDQETTGVIREYKNRLVRLGINPERIIVFGSYATGTNKDDSDLDILVIADAFEKLDLWKRMALLGRARAGITRPMEILGTTPGEAENLEEGDFIRDEVLDKGLVVGWQRQPHCQRTLLFTP